MSNEIDAKLVMDHFIPSVLDFHKALMVLPSNKDKTPEEIAELAALHVGVCMNVTMKKLGVTK